MNLDHLYGTVSMGQGSAVGEHCTLGYPKEARIRAFREDPATAEAGEPVGIGDRCMLFNQVIVYEGVSIADGCLVEDRVRIGYDSRVGPGSRIVYGAYICDRVSIGAEARIAGFVCDATRIGDRCTVMGDLVHEYTRPHVDWWTLTRSPHGSRTTVWSATVPAWWAGSGSGPAAMSRRARSSPATSHRSTSRPA